MNSETGPIRLVSWTPFISSSGANLEGGGEFYRGLPRGDFYRGLLKAFRGWGQVNSETGPIRLVSRTPYISSSGANLAGG